MSTQQEHDDITEAIRVSRHARAAAAVAGKSRWSFDEKREYIESMPDGPEKFAAATLFRCEIARLKDWG